MAETTNPSFEVSIEWIGPTQARRYLEDTERNPRKVMPAVVDRYARVMVDKKWFLGSGFIAFDQTGSLVQGQHTCHAVIQSGATIEMVVYRGLTPDAVKALDTGKTRLYSHVLRAEGVINSTQVGSALRILWQWEHGGIIRNITPALTELEEYRMAHPGVVDSVHVTVTMSKPPIRFMSSVAAPLHYMTGEIHQTELRDEFFTAVQYGHGLESTDPRLRLREWLIRDAANPRRSSNIVLLGVGIKAWNAFVDGKEMRQLHYRRGTERMPQLRGLIKDWPEYTPMGDVEPMGDDTTESA